MQDSENGRLVAFRVQVKDIMMLTARDQEVREEG
jgi:hypothetical protein